MKSFQMRSEGSEQNASHTRTPRVGHSRATKRKFVADTRSVSGGDQFALVSHVVDVSAGKPEGGQRQVDPQISSAPLEVIVGTIVELWRRRQSWHQSEKSETLRIKGLCRRACPSPAGKTDITVGADGRKSFAKNPDADVLYKAIMKGDDHHPKYTETFFSVEPHLVARDILRSYREGVEKKLLEYAAQLPGYEFCTSTPAITPALLYSVVGEAPGVNHRSLLDFATQYRLWKRLGLSVMSDGSRQRRVTGSAGLTHGYDARRRAMVWTFGDVILKKPGTPYHDVYKSIRKRERTKWNDRNIVVLAAADIARIQKQETIGDKCRMYDSILAKESDEEKADRGTPISINLETEFRNKKHFLSHCKRLMEKQLIEDLWKAFRRDATQV